MPKNKTSKSKLESLISVQELIEALQDLDMPDAKVAFSYNYGDHWNTEVVEGICGEPEETLVAYSEYHRKFKVIEDGNGDDDDAQSVILLR